MPRTNGKSQIEDQLDAEHELPSADENEESQGGRVEPRAEHVSEVEKLRAERDALIDRLARMQADFDNARKRAAKEQADFRDYALADAIKTLIPVLDSFDRALKTSAGKIRVPLGRRTHPQTVAGRIGENWCPTGISQGPAVRSSLP